MEKLFSRGSQWRKWDLHVHTPASVLNNGFGSDWDVYVRTLFNEAIKNEISTIGITDYFTIEGYKKIRNEYIKNEERLKELFKVELSLDINYLEKVRSILLLPNIEFRIDKVLASKKDGQERRLNYHVIFSDEVDIVDIEENFLHNLDILYEGNPGDGISRRKLKKHNIEELGRKLKEEHEPFKDRSDYYIGCMNAYVEISSIDKILKKDNQAMFKNNHLLVLADDYISLIDWNGQGHNTRKTLCAISNMVFSSNKNTIEWGLDENTEIEFGSRKPCIWGLDAHSYDKLYNPDNEMYCWIKADTTFEGLLQVLHEPEERVYIGKKPNKIKMIEENKSRYIDSIVIKRVENANVDDEWFNNEIELNSSLVAVVGNKGSGKSAIADIIALSCNSKNQEHFSFLNDERFGKAPEKLSQYFESCITWADGSETDYRQLSSKINFSDIERVKYLPQKYIEKVCNDLGDNFVEEINKMIFSYLPEAEKLAKNSFNELIEFLCSSIDDKIKNSKNELEVLNKKIIILEDKQSEEYINTIQNKVRLKYEEIVAHKKSKPAPKVAPQNYVSSEENKRLSEIDTKLKNIDEEIKKNEQNLKWYNIADTEFKHLNEKVSDLKDKYEKTLTEIKEVFDKYKITDGIESIIQLKVDTSNISKYIKVINDKKNNVQVLIEQDKQIQTKESLYIMKELLNNKKSSIVTKVNSEIREYQAYLDELENWKKRKKELIGQKDEEGTFKNHAAEYRYIKKKLDKDLEVANKARQELIDRIYELMVEKTNHYKKIYKYAIECLKDIGESDDGINFSVEILPSKSFINDLLDYINQGISSVFYGKTEGFSKMKEIVSKYNYNNKEDIVNFIEEVYTYLTLDKSKVNKLLKRRNEFYNFLWSLHYLKIEYKLKLGKKNLEQLSPGEKGAILLIFYLALDRDNCPLIIDQPEDNLDNQSVYEKLVPFIRKAKNRRQVIIVTHNPNIAVACDAEQIIYTEMDKSNNKVTYETGSIENLNINKKIVDVLEGTMPAFTLRKVKYMQEDNL